MTYFIAELGANIFPYSRSRSARFVEAAAEAGADAVKVQLFRAGHFPNEERAEKMAHEFPRSEFARFVQEARRLELSAGASVFDKDAIRICDDTGADFVKLATREEANRPLREHCRHNFHRTIIRSIRARWPTKPLPARWPREITLGCIPDYPADEEIALRFLRQMTPAFHEPWGWSSHTAGHDDCAEAVRRGASVIEKHIKLAGADVGEQAEANWSLFPRDFARMVEECRGL